MTSTLNGMDPDRHAAVRALLVQQARAATSPIAGSVDDTHTQRSVWKRRKLVLTSTGGLIAAGLAVVTVVTVSRPLPAYAVTGGNGKEVKVEVNRLEGPRSLEEALRKKGIPADITYLPSHQACQPGRYVDDSPRGLSLSTSAERFEVVIPAGAVSAGETFVLSASVTPLDGGTGVSAAVDFGVAVGPIAPCAAAEIPEDQWPERQESASLSNPSPLP